MDLLKQAANVAGKVASEPKPAESAPAPAPAEAKPADAAPAPDQAAAPAADPAAAPVDVKGSLMAAFNDAKTGNYTGAVQDVLKTGLVQKFAQDHAGDVQKLAGNNETVGKLVGQATAALGKKADPNAPAGGDLMGSLGGLVSGLGGKKE